jgi:hypothetical protein
MSETELKPCPFCDGKAKRNDDKQHWGDIFCDSCGCHMAEGSMNKAVESWNTRTSDKRIAALEIQNTELLDTINKLIKELQAVAHDG